LLNYGPCLDRTFVFSFFEEGSKAGQFAFAFGLEKKKKSPRFAGVTSGYAISRDRNPYEVYLRKERRAFFSSANSPFCAMIVHLLAKAISVSSSGRLM